MSSLKSVPENSPRPWYREFWLWFILAPLITVVVVSTITVTLAVSGADEVVDGPYIKKGRMLHLEPKMGTKEPQEESGARE